MVPCFLAALHGLDGELGGGFGEGGEDAAGVEPARRRSLPKMSSQSMSPGFIWVAAVWPRSGTPTGAADAEAALGEVEAVADGAADAVDLRATG